MTKSKWLLLVVTFSLLMALTHFGNGNYIRGDPKLDFDSPFYVKLLLWLKGEYPEPPGQPFRMRVLNPFLASYLSALIGVNNAFGALNTAFWIITCLVYFLALSKYLGSNELAAISCILFSGSIPVLVYGAAISTDMIGWLALAVAVYYVQKPIRFQNIILMGVCMYIFMFGREVSILAIAYIFIYRLIKGEKISKIFLESMILGAFSILAVLTLYMIIPNPGYTAYFYSSFLNAGNVEKISKAVKQLAATYHIGWIPLIAYSLSKTKKDTLFNTSVIVGGTFVFIDHFIGTISSRFVFLTYPGLLPAILLGTKKLLGNFASKKFQKILFYSFVSAYVLVGFILTLENNLAFPTVSDEAVAKLFPEGYNELFNDRF